MLCYLVQPHSWAWEQIWRGFPKDDPHLSVAGKGSRDIMCTRWSVTFSNEHPAMGLKCLPNINKSRLNRNSEFYKVIIFLFPLTSVTGYKLLLSSGFPLGNSHLTTAFFTGIPSAPQVPTTFSLRHFSWLTFPVNLKATALNLDFCLMSAASLV